MKRIGLIFSLFIVLMCSGCGPILEPLIEGTYTSYNEEKNETFSKGKFTIKEITKEEYEEFVRNEYGNGGKGFIIDGKKYSVWFNKNGMQIALGETVRTKDKIYLSWEQVTNRIHCLLKEGEFAP